MMKTEGHAVSLICGTQKTGLAHGRQALSHFQSFRDPDQGPERVDVAYRDQVMEEFRSGVTKEGQQIEAAPAMVFTQWQVLISTDVLSRGIDVPAVTLVVNYELPMSYSSYGQPDYETYMHRIGRTGRFGLKGVAVNLVSDRDRHHLDSIQSFYKCTMMKLSGDCEEMEALLKGLSGQVYEYNRDNFKNDREQRMKKEFHERKYRVIQGQLWREDVRDFISLTEQKMSLYLIINVLLLSFTVTMWVEGQLPETTPDWLVIGYQIASVVAFSYLVLTIWLAMHAAVSAQSYQARILTQLVRLPLPTWKELEAARTAASEFEKVESRCSTLDMVVIVKELRVRDSLGGDANYELNNYSGAEVAELRHIKLLRQAAVYWQTYDAFARVSMSVGINQLMLGMSYYILGYAMLEVKAPCAALGGVLAFMGSSEVQKSFQSLP
eukprot:g28327.t1